MNGGTVARNSAARCGGGVVVGEAGSFVSDGGGLSFRTFTLNNGIITQNRASMGSAVYIGALPRGTLHIPSTGNSFIATGGSIRGNSNDDGGPRFGVYIWGPSSTFAMGGGFFLGDDNYFYLSTGTAITLKGPLNAVAVKGILIEPEISAPGTVLVKGNPEYYLQDYEDSEDDDLGKFAYFDRNSGKKLELLSNSNTIVITEGGE
jgi:hypothetical protein